MTQLTKFDYASFDTETQVVLRTRTTEIKDTMRRTAQGIVQIGEALADVQARLAKYGSGLFQAWLKTEFNWSKSTAYNFINVFEKFGDRPNFGQISIAASALYLLAAPSTPDEAREEALERAEAGEVIGYSTAKTIVTNGNGKHIDAETGEIQRVLEQYTPAVREIAINAAKARYGSLTPSRVERIADVVDTVQRSGFANNSDGEPTHLEEALNAEDVEALKRSKEYQHENGRQKPKTNRVGEDGESSPFDRCQTPPSALVPLLPYLKPDWCLWEPARGEGLLVAALESAGFGVTSGDILTGENFFDSDPRGWDCQVTNPPYSKKYKWLQRCYDLSKPFALLLPVETLGAKSAQVLFREYGVGVIFMDGRVNFKMPNKGWEDSSAQFPTAWFTWGLGIDGRMIFSEGTP